MAGPIIRWDQREPAARQAPQRSPNRRGVERRRRSLRRQSALAFLAILSVGFDGSAQRPVVANDAATSGDGSPCTFAIQCDDGDPCTLDGCSYVLGAPVETGTCRHDPVADGQPGGCDDGAICNGAEVCASGVCASVDVPDCESAAKVCDASRGGCADPCASDADCSDLDLCNGTETCGAGGLCRPGENPCGGPGARCAGRRCSGSGVPIPCSSDLDCPAGRTCDAGLVCFFGRCCTESEDVFLCAARRFPPNGGESLQCTSGRWFAGDAGGARFQVPCACPLYSSGIVATADDPQGPHLVVVGPVSDGLAVRELTGAPLNRTITRCTAKPVSSRWRSSGSSAK